MLNQDQISNYHKDGYLSGIPILNEVEAGHYREQFDALEKREGDPSLWFSSSAHK